MDFGVTMAYVCVFLATGACVWYGVRNWNKGGSEITREDRHWAKEEKKIEKEFE